MFTGRVVYVIIFSEYISDEWSGRGEKGHSHSLHLAPSLALWRQMRNERRRRRKGRCKI